MGGGTRRDGGEMASFPSTKIENRGGRCAGKSSASGAVDGSSTATQVLVGSLYLESVVVNSNKTVLQADTSRSTSNFGMSTALQ